MITLVISFLINFSPFAQTTNSSQSTIRIGLLVSKDTAIDDLSKEFARAAMLAVKERNALKNLNSKAELIIKSCDGKWGAGSKESVSLVYDHDVSVIIAALDGRNAHLAEQVATKAQVVLLSTQAQDPTLSQINIPWFFRINLSDEQVTEELINELFEGPLKSEVVIVEEQGYDANMAKNTFIKALEKINVDIPLSYSQSAYLSEKSSENVIVYFGSLEGARSLEKYVADKIIYYASLYSIVDRNSHKNKKLVPVISDWSASLFIAYKSKFYQSYNNWPSIQSASTYDGVKLILDVMERSGSDRQKMRNELSRASFMGITGAIRFDNSGNRKATVRFTDVSSIP